MEKERMMESRQKRLSILLLLSACIVFAQCILPAYPVLIYLLILPLLISIQFRRSKAAYFYAVIFTLISAGVYFYLSFANSNSFEIIYYLVFVFLLWISAYFIHQLKRDKIRIEAQKRRYEQLSSELSSKLDTKYNSEVNKQKTESSALRLAIRSGGVGIWDWDLKSNEMHWDEQMYILYGRNKSNFECSYHNWENCLAREDRQLFADSVQRAVTGNEPLNITCRIFWPDLSVRHIKMLGYVDRDDQKKALRFVGTNWDVTNDKRSEEALVDYKDQLEQIVERRTNVMHELNENLDRNEELLKHMSNVGKIGAWEYLKDDSHLLWTSQIFSILENETGEVPTLEDWNKMYAPEVRGLIVKSFNNCLSRKEGFELELPLITAKDNRIWVKIIAEAKVKEEAAVGVRGIFQDITKEKELKDSLIKINEELDAQIQKKGTQLEQVSKELETFSYTVSHDLRTPLRAIEGFSKAMMENYAGILDEDGERWLNYIVDNTDKMGRLISDILIYSRIARAEVQEEELNMNSLVEEKFDLLKAEYRGIVLKINVEKLPKAMGDRELIGQIWLQLLSNALKFSTTKEEVCIDVSGKMENNCVIYTVKDKGVGFDQRYVDKIYTIFQRLHADDEFSGSGVGLAMVDRILKKHGGKISAESELGIGTSISFTLPL